MIIMASVHRATRHLHHDMSKEMSCSLMNLSEELTNVILKGV